MKYVNDIARAIYDLGQNRFSGFKFTIGVWAEAVEWLSNKSPLTLSAGREAMPSLFEAHVADVRAAAGPKARREALTKLMAACAWWVITSHRTGEDLVS